MTTTLMTYAGPGEPDALVTRTGGIPLAPAGASWPSCATCSGPMQFLAQILLDGMGRPVGKADTRADRVLAIFMCQNDPGMCEEWSPTAGGNRALLYPCDALQRMAAPESNGDGDVLRLGAVNAVTLVCSPSADYFSAREEWGKRSGNRMRNILGQLGGQADWLQGNETPTCSTCTQPMILIAQLEEGPDHSTAMNFGGCGTAFAFACGPCAQASFLWQC
ncbi:MULTISPECIES: hypothetical protein [unclassified Streptomyces]|uniref:hypothetical protein n=1 Tax=unclassified Streptomyces TaxID=2593676 RepID=UPI002E12E15C|nr:YwqG family protein [Streptomyces sp. NBC_01197]WSS52524.1 YwqG family protein [Streptomyces sp. NBC_01180]